MKARRMLAREVAKLKRDLPALMASARFNEALCKIPDCPRWTGWSQRFNCLFVVQLILSPGSTPWLACRFEREPLYEPWIMGDPRNKLFADARDSLGANPYSGKYNCHLAGRHTAAEAMGEFRLHLLRAIGFPQLAQKESAA